MREDGVKLHVFLTAAPRECKQLKCQAGAVKVKGLPQQAEVAQGVPGRLRPRIFLTFGTTMVVGCQPYVPAAFTPGEIRGTNFLELRGAQRTWFCR